MAITDILFDCDNQSTQGLEKQSLLILREDIDFTGITFDAENVTITSFPLLSAKTGVFVESNKNTNSASSEFVKGDVLNGNNHSFTGRFFNLDATSLDSINSMQCDQDFVMIVPTKYKGANGAAGFKVLGLDVGMKMQEGRWASEEEKGTYIFTIGSEDGYEEPKPLYLWLETDYATTKTRFDAKLGA